MIGFWCPATEEYVPQADRLVISFLWDIDQPSFEHREICVYVTGQHVPWFVNIKLNSAWPAASPGLDRFRGWWPSKLWTLLF